MYRRGRIYKEPPLEKYNNKKANTYLIHTSHVQCRRQLLPKVHCKLKEGNVENGMRESSYLYNKCKFLDLSLPPAASLDPKG
jgi:hypothetical protein